MVVGAQPLPAAEVRPPVGLVQAADQLDAALLEQHDGRPVGDQAVGQEDVAGGEHVPQPAEQADLALPLAGVPAEPEVHDRPARQRDHRPDAGDREAEARLLVVDLRVGRLVLGGVRHRDRRAVEQVHPPPLPQPAPLGPDVQGAADGTGHGGEERLRQALAGLAVGAGLGGAGPLPAGEPVGDQAGDGGAAGVVGAEDLAQEDPQRHQRGEDPVQPAADGGQRFGDDVLGEDVGERQVAVLEELPSAAFGSTRISRRRSRFPIKLGASPGGEPRRYRHPLRHANRIS